MLGLHYMVYLESMKKAYALLVVGAIALAPRTALAAVESDLEGTIAKLSLDATGIATAILVALLLLTAVSGKHPKLHTPVFLTMAVTIIVTSLFLVGSTVYLNTVSSSKGPVHWHADFEIWACGEQQELADPTGFLSNKVGTPTLHEHNDKRIHLEGVVVKKSDASLGKFFRVVDGELTRDSLTINTTKGAKTYISGQSCANDKSELQVFVYRTNADKSFSQQKVADPAAHIIKDTPNVPPGDCIIIEFDRPKDRTDRLCVQYQYAKQRGELKGEL